MWYEESLCVDWGMSELRQACGLFSPLQKCVAAETELHHSPLDVVSMPEFVLGRALWVLIFNPSVGERLRYTVANERSFCAFLLVHVVSSRCCLNTLENKIALRFIKCYKEIGPSCPYYPAVM